MADIITCPACQKQLQVPEELFGQSVQCPDCKHPFIAQALVSEAAKEPPVAESGPLEPAAAPKPRWEEGDGALDVGRGQYEPNRGAIILTLGIVSLLLMGTCLVPLVLGPMAWVMGNTDLRAIRSGRMDPEGEGMVQAGRILGIVGFIMGLLVLAAVCVYFAFLGLMIAAFAGRAPQQRRKF